MELSNDGRFPWNVCSLLKVDRVWRLRSHDIGDCLYSRSGDRLFVVRSQLNEHTEHSFSTLVYLIWTSLVRDLDFCRSVTKDGIGLKSANCLLVISTTVDVKNGHTSDHAGSFRPFLDHSSSTSLTLPSPSPQIRPTIPSLRLYPVSLLLRPLEMYLQ